MTSYNFSSMVTVLQCWLNAAVEKASENSSLSFRFSAGTTKQQHFYSSSKSKRILGKLLGSLISFTKFIKGNCSFNFQSSNFLTFCCVYTPQITLRHLAPLTKYHRNEQNRRETRTTCLFMISQGGICRLL